MFYCRYVLSSLAMVISPSLVLAAVRTSLEKTANGAGLANICSGSQCIGVLVGAILNIVFGFLGILLIGYILYGGYVWMTTGGETDKTKEARTVLRNAVIGVFIVGFSYTLSNAVIGYIRTSFQEIQSAEGELTSGVRESGGSAPTEGAPGTVLVPTPPPFAPGCNLAACRTACTSLAECRPLALVLQNQCITRCQGQCERNCTSVGAECRPTLNYTTCRERCVLRYRSGTIRFTDGIVAGRCHDECLRYMDCSTSR